MISWYDRNKKKREKSWDKIYNQFGFLDRIFLVLTLWTKQVVLKNMEVENITIPGPKLRPILLLKSMEAENIFLTLCPRDNHTKIFRLERPSVKSISNFTKLMFQFCMSTSVAVNYRYRRYKSIWKSRSIIDMDFSISIYQVSNLTSAIMG